MSIASMPSRASIFWRIEPVQGSAPKMPISSEVEAGSTPSFSRCSTMFSTYEGVTMMIRGLKSRISWTCRSVAPPLTGTTVQPRRSAP